jgi:hypothetical protein
VELLSYLSCETCGLRTDERRGVKVAIRPRLFLGLYCHLCGGGVFQYVVELVKKEAIVVVDV